MRPEMRHILLSLLLILCAAAQAFAAPQFPALSGRVVDGAAILSAAGRSALDKKLAEYEAGTTNQVVVVTVASLQDYSIEEYGYQLGRQWQVGQKGRNNGALLIVAPTEKKVRIEVGYGLEPLLTDAASSAIIHGIILPAFREGQMEKGITEGVDAMLSVLGGKGVPVAMRPNTLEDWQAWLILLLMLWFFVFSFRHPGASSALLAASASRFGSSRLSGSGWGGSGFRGGGGSFGGGGASGRW